MTSRLSFPSHTCCVDFPTCNGLRMPKPLRDQAALRDWVNCSGSCVALRQPTVNLTRFDIEVTNTSRAQRDTASGLLCRCQQTWLGTGVLMQAHLFASFQHQR